MDKDQVPCTGMGCGLALPILGHVALSEIRSPGLHSSRTYSPEGVDTWSGSRSCSIPVPPEGNRTKRFDMGAVICEPGIKDRAPFSRVHRSKAIQNPSAVGGEVYLCSVSGADQKKKKNDGRHTRKVL
jgi:hypothetical protein